MEHRQGAALRSGCSVLTAVISDNTALHTAIHTAIQVAEGHQLTAGARKLAGRRPANFSSIRILELWGTGPLVLESGSPMFFTHASCGSIGLQTDFLPTVPGGGAMGQLTDFFSSFSFTPLTFQATPENCPLLSG